MNEKFKLHNSSALTGIEINVIIVIIMIAYFVYDGLTGPSLSKSIIYGLFLMIIKNAIPVATGIASSKKIREGLIHYFQQDLITPQE